ncbi:MAG: 50S ribosomal protein L29 [Nanoarchaeota archaeon]|nr:50S ribosomal protein L29 [Nanoarchaeota archaeon]
MKTRDLKALSTEELNKKLSELKFELIKANSQVASGSAPKNPGMIRQMRRTVARILTFIHQRKEAVPKDG